MYFLGRLQSTDPTYKEWKLCLMSCSIIISLRTDPTYKEWKPKAEIQQSIRMDSTDPTYKEWKLVNSVVAHDGDVRARILPTRNGN